jgi:hypothetical protein
VATLEELNAQKEKLAREYEAIQAEFSAGKNFTSGQAEIDREQREIAKFKELSDVNKQIRAQSGQASAAGNAADTTVTNNLTQLKGAGQGNNSPTPTTNLKQSALSPKETNNLVNANQREEAAQVAPAALSDPSRTNNSEAPAASEPELPNFVGSGTNTEGSVIFVEMSGVGISPTVDMSEVAQTIPAQLLKNKLHDYTGYTYKITLFLLTVDDYTELSVRPNTFVPKHTLISSGGVLPNYFQENIKTNFKPKSGQKHLFSLQFTAFKPKNSQNQE